MQRLLSRLLVITFFAGFTFAANPYYGKLVGSLSKQAHNVQGTVYAVDNTRIHIRNFYYDGEGPDAYFYYYKKDNPSNIPNDNGLKGNNEKGSPAILTKYDNANITLTLPDGIQVTDLKILSVWCKQFGVDFGHVTFPSNLVPPAERNVGPFSQLAHGLKSGDIIIKDAKTFYIPNLHYDGFGPDAYFWVGAGTPDINGRKVPNEGGSLKKLPRFTGQSVTITLPDALTVFDIDYLSMWCVAATQNFGHVLMPNDLNIPPYIVQPADAPLGSPDPVVPHCKEVDMNCESLHDDLHVSWKIVQNTHIMVELSGKIADEDYMAFGLSGSDSSTSMINADVTVAFYDSGPHAVDYFLSAYAQCSNGQGVCPDTASEKSGSESNTDVSGQRVDGITTIKYKRPLNTGDPADKPIALDKEMFIAWGIGPLNSVKQAAKHNIRVIGNVKLNFNRSVSNNCKAFSKGPAKEVVPWTIPPVVGDTVTVFNMTMGQAGGKQGYSAITKHASWGIAWYVNGVLIPELILKRYVNYTFIINGGEFDNNTARYHPFYITDDKVGGYEQYSAEKKKSVRIFPGYDQQGKSVDFAHGRYCEYELKKDVTNTEAPTFDQFKEKLELKCDSGKPGVFTWMADQSTPNTVYYQCSTHRYLGWKITVVNDFADIKAGNGCGAMTTQWTIFTSFILSFYYFVQKLV